MPLKLIISLYFFLVAYTMYAQPIVIPLNKDWQFTTDKLIINDNKNDTHNWQQIELPHTWNTDDVMDDTPGYYRGEGWYRKRLVADKTLKGKEVHLFFEGANQVTTVFVNGKKAGEHTGGYTAFSIPITSLLTWNNANEIVIKVDNSYNRNIPPLTADFTFYGGIYRDVSLVAVDPIHFSFNEQGSRDVFITTPQVNNKMASVKVRGVVADKGISSRIIKISTAVYDKKGKKIKEKISTIVTGAGTGKKFEQEITSIAHPRLWSPAEPYLYKVVTTIVDAKTGKTLDVIINPLGFRWFHFDAAKGFFLNGKPTKLIGASRHQDYKGMGNAVPDKLARRDVELIKEMGGNFLRVAHYPQDPSVLQACDELGIVASVEIPIVNEITESDSFYENCERMQVEMIRQNFNHPSVIMWCYMNEVLLKPQFNTDKGRQKIYFSNITKLARRLDSITRKEDPYRYTMMAHHGDFNRYRDVGLIDIPMIVGWNLYSGWYGGNLNDFPSFLDQFHKTYPGKPMMVTEYGADADPRIHSTNPVRFDKSVEYTTALHQYYLAAMMDRPFVAAAMIWNLADFNSETRTESMPHINNKGLLQWDRTPKDTYYYYKAMLAKKPFIKILGPSFRGAVADSATNVTHQTLQVAGNVEEVMLTVNGKQQERKRVINGIGEWKVPFQNGINNIEVKAQYNGIVVTDHQIIEYRLQPYQFINDVIPFRQLNILLGAKRYFTDSGNELWIPDQPYHEGSWGYTGGKAFKLSNNNRLPYGTDKNIKGTADDPIYQTQQTGIEKYNIDVPPGEYELTLYFSELMGGIVKGLEYNLADGDRIEPNGKRIFDIIVNGNQWLKNFNIAEQYGLAIAVEKIIKITVAGTGGIEIVFKPIEGEPVLNALKVKSITTTRQEADTIK